MDTICGIGLPELIILALVGFVVIGPDRSRDLALQLGRFLRTVMKSPWWKEFNQMASAIRDMPTTLVRMAELEDELRTVRTELDRATHFDFNQQPGSPAAGRPVPPGDPSQDPWGVMTPPPPLPPAESANTIKPPTDDEPTDHV